VPGIDGLSGDKGDRVSPECLGVLFIGVCKDVFSYVRFLSFSSGKQGEPGLAGGSGLPGLAGQKVCVCVCVCGLHIFFMKSRAGAHTFDSS